MNEINVNLSINNVPQFDRSQNDIHREPMVNQTQNAQIAQESAEQRVRMPVQLEQLAGKRIDSNAQKKEIKDKEKKKRRNKLPGAARPQMPTDIIIGPDSGRIVDVDA
jgi:hypothetical protein